MFYPLNYRVKSLVVTETEASDAGIKTLGLSVGSFDSLSQFEIHKAFKRIDEFWLGLFSVFTNHIPNLFNAEQGVLLGLAGLLHGCGQMLYSIDSFVSRGSHFFPTLPFGQAGLNSNVCLSPMFTIRSASVRPTSRTFLGKTNGRVFAVASDYLKGIDAIVLGESIKRIIDAGDVLVELVSVLKEAVKFPLVLEYVVVAHVSSQEDCQTHTELSRAFRQ